MKPAKLDAVVAGYLGVDITPGFASDHAPVPAKDFLRPGKLTETEGLTFSIGGVVANAGLTLKQLGQRVALMGCVGRDALGEIVLAQLRRHGAATGLRRKKGARTAYGIVVAPPGVDRIFFEDPGCNAAFSANDLDYKIISRSRLFHFGYPPLMRNLWADDGIQLKNLLQRVRKRGVATSLDMSLPDADSPAGRADWQAILANVLPEVDIFVPSVEEILFMLEPENYKSMAARWTNCDSVESLIPEHVFGRLASRIMAFGVKVVMLKAGPRGAYLRTGDVAPLNARTSLALPAAAWNNRSLWVESLPVDPEKVRNACGAGDCAVAGFLSGILNGETLERAGRLAMLAGKENLHHVHGFLAGRIDRKERRRSNGTGPEPAVVRRLRGAVTGASVPNHSQSVAVPLAREALG